MMLSDLQNKDIVNVSDGKKIGNIMDVKINYETGFIESIALEGSKGLFSFGKNDIKNEIPWKSIVKIGTDVILIDSSMG